MPSDPRPVALVTGGNRGIGAEVARQLHARGFTVVIGSRDADQGRHAAARLDPAVQTAYAVQFDITDPGSISAAADVIRARNERLDVLVNNAAIHYDTWQQASAADLTVVQEALEVNILGAWRVTLAVLPLLRNSPHARIVNVSSEGGSLSEMTGGTPAYSVSKAGLNALTRLLAGELHAAGILVNAVCPGWTATEMGGWGGRPVTQGAASVTWAALLPDDGPTGGFWRDGKPLPW